MDVSVIIVNFNGREFTPPCLDSLPDGVETIVVDNGSSDGSADAFAEAYPSVTLVRNPVNRGFAAAVNQALEGASGRYVLLLNNDARLTPEALSRLTGTLDRDPGIGICAPQLLHEDGRRQHSFANLPTLATELLNKSLLRLLNPGKYPSKRQEYTEPRDVESVIGACMLVRRELVDRIGPLDQAYFLFLEETDWCLRARRAGSRVVFVPDAKVTHLQGKSRAKVAVRARIEYVRSLFTFFRKHRRSWPILRAIFPLKNLLEVLLQTLAVPFSASLRRRWVETISLLAWQARGCPASWGLSGPAEPKYLKTLEGVSVAEDHLDAVKAVEKGATSGRAVKHHRRKRTVEVEAGGKTYLVKSYLPEQGLRALRRLLTGSKAAREYRNNLELLRRGIPMVPLAAVKDQGDERWVAVEKLRDWRDLQEVLLSPELDPRERQALVFHYGRFARWLQEAGVWQYDFNPTNVLVKGRLFRLIDFEWLRVRRAPLSRSVRFALVSKMNRIPELSRTDRLRFLKGYVDAFKEERGAIKTIARELLARAADKDSSDDERQSRRCMEENRDFGSFEFGSVRGFYRKSRPDTPETGATLEEVRGEVESDGRESSFEATSTEDALDAWKKANREARKGRRAPVAVLLRGAERKGALLYRKAVKLESKS